jgi:hypothetical protein
MAIEACTICYPCDQDPIDAERVAGRRRFVCAALARQRRQHRRHSIEPACNMSFARNDARMQPICPRRGKILPEKNYLPVCSDHSLDELCWLIFTTFPYKNGMLAQVEVPRDTPFPVGCHGNICVPTASTCP